jgi:hypothetical protein
MNKEKFVFAVGLAVGIFLTAVFFQVFAPRYATLQNGDGLIKQDRWSGRAWRYDGRAWEEIREAESRKEQIDQELRKALTVLIDQGRLVEATSRFKEIFPALREIPDDELLTRMSTLYSNQIMSTLFLESYHRSLEAKAKAFVPKAVAGSRGKQKAEDRRQ